MAVVNNVSMNTHIQCIFDIPISSGFMLRRADPHVSTSWVLGIVGCATTVLYCATTVLFCATTVLYWFSFPPLVHGHILSYTALPTCLTSAIVIIAITTRVTWYLPTDVIYIPWTANGIEYFFSYFCWSFWYILWRNKHAGPLPTFKLLYLFSCYWVGSLYVLDIGLCPDLFANALFLFVRVVVLLCWLFPSL